MDTGQAFSIPGCYSNTEFLRGRFKGYFAQYKGIRLVGFQLLTGKLVKRRVETG